MRRRGILSAVVGVALLAGCAGIPTSGDVQTVRIDSDPVEVPSIALPESPQPGQSPEEILEGFIRAGRGPQTNYSVAREFLAPGTEWSGTARVLVSSSPIEPVRVDESTYSITLNVTAEVDATGRYSPTSQQQTLLYEFTEVDGEYRISSAAPGTVLSAANFATVFDPYPLYFFDPSFTFLVPDLRWFPITRATADRIVDELLIGPSTEPGVLFSAFPAGTVGSATSTAPQVAVELSPEVRAESGRTQRRMLQQLQRSLAVLGNVSEVVVTADGLDLSPAVEGNPPEWRYAVGDLFGGAEGRVVEFALDGGLTSLPGIGARADDLGATAATLSRDERSLAVLGDDGVTLVGPSGAPIAIDERPGLAAPAIDPFGFVWTVPVRNPGGLRATDASGEVHDIRLAANGRIVSIELSRDGARLLVALATDDGPRLFVAGVQRDADLAPVALSAPQSFSVDGPIRDVAWVDGMTIAVLRDPPSGTVVDLLPLGGPRESLGLVEGGEQIVGGTGREGIRVLTGDGVVLRPSAAGGWVDTGLTASFLGTRQ